MEFSVNEGASETAAGGHGLQRGQEVRVTLGAEDLGTGRVDDLTEDGSIVWVMFGGASPRRMFIPEDLAEITVVR